jgi:putative ABC transport system permease protein
VLLDFIFSLHNPFIVFGYLTIMVLIAALEATGRQVRTYQGHYVDCLISSAVGGGFVGIYGSAIIFHPNPWWSPAVLIPTSGMVIGFSVSGPAIAVERLLSEVADKRHEAETRLAFGATDYESVLGIVKSSISAALLPTMNQMAIMGLVSIPGMMTGQLIGGTSPAVAAEYQMAILYLLVTTATISSTTSVLLAVRHALFDREHRLTPEKLIKSGKVEIDVAIYRVVSQLGQFIWKYLIRCELFSSPSSSALSVVAPPVAGRAVYAPLSDASQHQLEMARNSGISDEENGDETVVALNETTHAWNTIAEDGLVGRVTYEIVANTPIYSPRSPVSRADAWPFFAVHQANVKSGSGKLFVSSYSTQMSGLSFCLMPGERITLEGPSGIGKTRLLRALAELDPLYEGHASFLGHSTKKLQPSTDYVKNHDWYRGVSARGSRGLQLVTVPEWRARVIYVPQALPPLAGTPLSLIKESCGFRSRRDSPGAKAIDDGT